MAEGIFAVHDLGQQHAKPALRYRIEGSSASPCSAPAPPAAGILNG
jgi:hypothetical protein